MKILLVRLISRMRASDQMFFTDDHEDYQGILGCPVVRIRSRVSNLGVRCRCALRHMGRGVRF